MKKQYIIISEVFDILNSEKNSSVSDIVKREINYFCDFTDGDIDSNYAFADLIRSRRSRKSWELIKNSDGVLCMQLDNASNELRPTVFKTLQLCNVIHDGIMNNATNII